MMKHLANYGDCNMEDITTEYIQNFIIYLEKQGLQRSTVRLYFQKLACVLNDAYKNELFDERILRRVKRPKREQSKKSFLTERELKRLISTSMPERYDNMKNMFLFSCSTGLRFSDVANLQWKNVKTHNKHLQTTSENSTFLEGRERYRRYRNSFAVEGRKTKVFE